MSVFSNYYLQSKLNRRLLYLSVMLIVLTVGLSFFALYPVFRYNKLLETKYNNQLNARLILDQSKGYVREISSGLKSLFIFEHEKKKKQLVTSVKNNYDHLREHHHMLANAFFDSRETTIFKEYNDLLIRHEQLAEDLFAVENSLKPDLEEIFSVENQLTGEIINKLERLSSINRRNLEDVIEKFDESKKKIYTQIILTSIIIIALIIFHFIYTVKLTGNSLAEINRNLSVLSKGEIPSGEIKAESNDFEGISHHINQIRNNLKRLSDFIARIIEGDYQAKYSTINGNDVLGNKVVELRDNLKYSRQEESKRKVEDEQRNWSTQGLAKFAEILRQSSENIYELAENIVQNTVHYIGAIQGGLFLYNDNNRENVYLELLASYAFNRKKFIQKTINLGDGLVGTCALEKETIHISDVPDDYLEISSGFGNTKPFNLLIVPLKIEETILGVMEIASLNEIRRYEIEFIERLGESIAVSLSAARINSRTKQLYEESKQQSAELTEKEEEMRQNIEEMRATQEQAQKREIEMRGILSAIDNTLIKCEYDTEGNFLSANSRYLDIMEYKESELLGKNVKMFVPEDKLEKFNLYWKNLLMGIPYQGIIERSTRTGDIRWLLMSYTPVKDNNRNIFKILFLANDITEFRMHEERAKQKALQLSRQNEELKREFELTYEKVQNRLQETQQTNELYENEMESMYAHWLKHLKAAESLHEKCAERQNIIDDYAHDIKEHENKITQMKEKMEDFKNGHLEQEPLYLSEVEQRYEDWLNSL
jgi:PAS domain S-box-containing protein